MNEVSAHVLTAIAIIGIIALFALSVGVDGNVAYLAIVAVAGLGGYEINQAGKAKPSEKP